MGRNVLLAMPVTLALSIHRVPIFGRRSWSLELLPLWLDPRHYRRLDVFLMSNCMFSIALAPWITTFWVCPFPF